MEVQSQLFSAFLNCALTRRNRKRFQGQMLTLRKITITIIGFCTIATLVPVSHAQSRNGTATNGTSSAAVANLEFRVTNFSSSEMLLTGNNLVDNGTLVMTVNSSEIPGPRFMSRAVYGSKVQLYNASSRQAASFNTSFNFAIVVPEGAAAKGDGLTFLFTPTRDVPKSDYSSGGNLALYDVLTYNATNTSIHVVAVEFDTNSDATGAKDPSGDHVGLDINSFISTKAQSLKSSNAPFSELNTSSVAKKLTAWIDYDAVSGQLDVYLAPAPDRKQSATLVLSYQPLCLYQWAASQSYVGFTAATGSAVEVHTLSEWTFASTLVSNPLPPQNISIYPADDVTSGSSMAPVGVIVGASVGGAVALIFVVLLVALVCRKKRSGKDSAANSKQGHMMMTPFRFSRGKEILGPEDSFWLDLYGGDPKYGPKTFTIQELQEATNNFDSALIMGFGGSGKVYKGEIQGVTKDGTQKITVAVKRLSEGSMQRVREFRAEVQSIGQLRHRNLVHLYGWCHDEGELLLVYEYMPFGSLDKHLYSSEGPVLPWDERYNILCGVAETLVYLHVGCEKCIVHRDIKPSNVLLDSSRNARLGDFGLARLVDHRHSARDHSTAVAGTRGYLAPEYAVSGKATPESDIYSFGVLTLVVACGQRPYQDEENYIVDRAWAFHEGNELVEGMADDRLAGNYDIDQMRRVLTVGLLCTHPDPTQRLPSRKLLQALNASNEGESVELPKLPQYRPVAVYVSVAPEVKNLTRIPSRDSGHESTANLEDMDPNSKISIDVKKDDSRDSASQELLSLTFPR